MPTDVIQLRSPVAPRPLPLPSALWAVLRSAGRAFVLIFIGRVRQPRDWVGTTVRFDDGSSSSVYRETVIQRPPPVAPALLVVTFRLRHVRRSWAHRLFRIESELNTVLFAGFPGLVSKLWLQHDEHHRYRGVYQWDGADQATAYARALWWVLRLVSVRDSIQWTVVPGVDRDAALREPVFDERHIARGR